MTQLINAKTVASMLGYSNPRSFYNVLETLIAEKGFPEPISLTGTKKWSSKVVEDYLNNAHNDPNLIAKPAPRLSGYSKHSANTASHGVQ